MRRVTKGVAHRRIQGTVRTSVARLIRERQVEGEEARRWRQTFRRVIEHAIREAEENGLSYRAIQARVRMVRDDLIPQMRYEVWEARRRAHDSNMVRCGEIDCLWCYPESV